MKILYASLTFFILLVLPSILHADIDAQIEAIRHAPVAERFKLMNAFKQEIVQMKEEERIHAITQLKGITKSKYANRAINEIKNHAHTKKVNHKEQAMENETENQVESAVDTQIAEEVNNHIETEIEDQSGENDNDD